MEKRIFLPMNLCLFDGEGGAAPAAQGDGTGAPVGAQQAGEENINAVQTTSSTLDEKNAAWRKLIKGEYAQQYQDDMQRAINRRFKHTKELEGKVSIYQPIVDMLAQRYGEKDAAKLAQMLEFDSAYWAEAAEEAGMSVEQYMNMQRLQRENAALRAAQERAEQESAAQERLQKWYQEAEAVKERFPSFDLETEALNPQFLSMLRSGVPVETAYKVLHIDDMMTDAMSVTAARTERRVADNIRARGARPTEAGVSAGSAHVAQIDVTKMTRKQRAEIARRAMLGETITLK